MTDPKDIKRAREIAAGWRVPLPVLDNIASALTTAYAEGELAGYARGRAEGRLQVARQVAGYCAMLLAHQQNAAVAQAYQDIHDQFARLASTPAGTGEPT